MKPHLHSYSPTPTIRQQSAETPFFNYDIADLNFVKKKDQLQIWWKRGLLQEFFLV